MFRHTIRTEFRYCLNRLESRFLCVSSITKMRSAHISSSGVTGFSASWLRPAEATSIPGHDENKRSAVGLRSRFWLQINSTRFMRGKCTGRPNASQENEMAPGERGSLSRLGDAETMLLPLPPHSTRGGLTGLPVRVVQRGLYEAARCASTGDPSCHPASLSTFRPIRPTSLGPIVEA